MAEEQETELYSLRQNRVYTKQNALRKRVGGYFFLADTDGEFLITKIR